MRIPAACCGLVGIKPSRGAVSPGPYGVEGMGLTTDGVLARSVRDAAAGLDLLAGPRTGDYLPVPAPRQGYLAQLDSEAAGSRSLRIAVLREPLAAETEVHPAALRGLERALEVLRGLGHELTEIPAPFAPEDWTAFMPLWTVGAASIPLDEAQETKILELTRWLRERGRTYSGVELAQAYSGVQALARRTLQALAPFDVVISPVLSGPPAFPQDLQLPDGGADFDAQRAFTPWTSTWNMLGAPAVAVPNHREQIEGIELPFAVQLGAARHGEEALLLSLAAQLEAHDPWPLLPAALRA